MLFFRSEEEIKKWCAEHGYPEGPTVNMDQLWFMSTTWYGTRLQTESRRPQPDEIREISASIGLDDDFWDPRADSFE
jgi:hypothetical protein